MCIVRGVFNYLIPPKTFVACLINAFVVLPFVLLLWLSVAALAIYYL